MNPRPLDVAPDHLSHFARVERLADVIIRAQPERFLRGLQRAKPSQHDHRDVRIDLADAPQTINAARAGHADISDDGIRMFFLEKLDAGLDTIGGVDLIVRLQEHPQAFARTHFVIDDQDLREIGGNRHGG
jgi:hypothetical protein